MAVGLPPSKRYIATRCKRKSVYAESPDQAFSPGGSAIFMARSYSIANLPGKLKDDADLKSISSRTGKCNKLSVTWIVIPREGGKNNSANLLVVDLESGGFSAMHRTVSIDFSICTNGTIIHELDGGEQVTLKPGDHIVQRGTNHRWINASRTEPARFVAVTINAVPFPIAGKTLEEGPHTRGT